MIVDPHNTDTEARRAALNATDRRTVIQVNDLSLRLANRLILDRIRLSLTAGRIVALLGENGAGKTTLLRCLAGLVQPTSGGLLWFGQSPRQTRGLRRQIGFVAHQQSLYGELTSRENLLFAARMYGVADPVGRIEELLSDADLEHHAQRRVAELSQGLRQRLSICRSIVHQPPVLLLDEPFSGLDDEGREWVIRLLRQLRSRSTAICLTSHDLILARRLADFVLRLAGGRLFEESVDATFALSQGSAWEAAA